MELVLYQKVIELSPTIISALQAFITAYYTHVSYVTVYALITHLYGNNSIEQKAIVLQSSLQVINLRLPEKFFEDDRSISKVLLAIKPRRAGIMVVETYDILT